MRHIPFPPFNTHDRETSLRGNGMGARGGEAPSKPIANSSGGARQCPWAAGRAGAMSLTLLAIATIAAEEQVSSTAEDVGETLIVTADRQPNTLARTTASVSVLDPEEDRRDGYPQAWTQRLRRIPGVDLLSRAGGIDSGGFPGVRLRGTQKDSDTQVLVDGIPWNDATSTEGQPSLLAVQPAGIGSIEVVRGAQSGLYGSRSVGGVVNIRSLTPTNEHHGQLRLEGGSFHTLSTDASATGPLMGGNGNEQPVLGYVIGVSALDSDGFSTLTDAPDGNPGNHEDDAVSRLGANARLVFTPIDGVSWYGAGWIGSAMHKADELGPNDTLPEKQEKMWRAATGGTLALPLDSSVAVDAAWTHSKRENTSHFGDSRFIGDEQFASLRWTVPVTSWLSITPGIDVLRQNTDTETIGSSPRKEASQRNVGFWLQALAEGEAWEVSLVGRRDNHSNAGDATTYRIGGAWFPWSDLVKFHASVGTAFRAPSLDEQYGFYDFGFGFGFVGNPDLKAQTSVSSEIGITAKPIEQLELGSTLFATRYNNRIVIVSGSPPVFDTLTNEDKQSRIVGVENEAQWKFEGTPMELFATYTWQRTRDQDDHPFIGLPTHKGSVGLTATAEIGWLTLAADGVGDRDDRNQKPLPGYVTCSAVLGWQANTWLSLYVRGENLLDKAHTDARDFTPGLTNTSAPRSIFCGAQATY